MKIVFLYTIWTGDDMVMLMDSVDAHLPHVDEIHLWFQEVSNRGETELYKEKHRIEYKSSNSKIKTFFWTPDLDKNTKENERVKHNLMIQQAKNDGFTHFIMGACDHFYDEKAFNYGKKMMLQYGFDLCLTEMVTYYKTKDMILWPLENYCMPFIHKMYTNTAITQHANYPVTVDPSVKVNTSGNCHVIKPNDAILHHYSMVRKNISKKFRNAASSIRWTKQQIEIFENEFKTAKIGDKITYFQGRELIEAKKVIEKLK